MEKNSLILNNCIIEEKRGRACSLNQLIYIYIYERTKTSTDLYSNANRKINAPT